VGDARRFAREALATEQRETLETVELMISELATNCVRHARSDFEVTIGQDAGSIRVEVHDCGSGSPTLQSPTPTELSGRGLLLIEALSDAWGVDPEPGGKAVWFTIPGSPGESERTPSVGRDAA
jgi:anti-sigma regulatory factor (Ser/Thr protein kinase)